MEKQDSVYEKYVNQKIEEGLDDIEKVLFTHEKKLVNTFIIKQS